MNCSAALEMLGLKANYTEEQLKRSYRRLMKEYHPDLYTTKTKAEQLSAESKTKEINEAYEMLIKKLKYYSNSEEKNNSSYETSLEKTKRNTIDKLNVQLERLKNFFVREAFVHKEDEIRFIKEAIADIKNCKTDLEIFNVMRNLKASIDQNNLDLFNWLINNWQRDRFTKEALSEFYHNYSEQVKYAKSVIDIIELIKKLKQDCYNKVNEYENRIRKQIRQRLDSCIAKYYNDDFYCLINDKVDNSKAKLENKIFDIYLADDYDTSKQYFNDIILNLYRQFEEELLSLLKTANIRNKKIIELYNYTLDDNRFVDFLNSKINYLYTNILSENFETLYEKVSIEVKTMYRQLKLEKIDLNRIKNRLMQNYVISINQLDILKNSKEINIITELYQQALKLLTNFLNNTSLDLLPQLLNIDFSDLENAKKLIDNITFDMVSDACDIYIKRKKSNINGSVIKVRSIDKQVNYDYIIEKLNYIFSDTLSVKEFKENYISIQQFLQQATYIGKYAKVNQHLIGNVQGIALYTAFDNVLFLDLTQTKFKFVIIKDNITYFDEANVALELKNKTEVYKKLISQYSLTFEENDYPQSKTKKFFNKQKIGS